MPEPLIPDDVRAFYERLIEIGSQLIDAGDPLRNDPCLARTLDVGLARLFSLEPALLVATAPDAAFARMLSRWQRAMEARIDAQYAAQRAAVQLQRVALRSAMLRKPGNACVLVTMKDHVAALHDGLYVSAEHLVREFLTGPYGEARVLPTGEPQVVSSVYIGPEVDYRMHGGRTLMLHDQENVDASYADLYTGYADGEESRVVQKKLPMKLLIVDNHTALVPLGGYGHPCLLIRDAELVGVFVAFFELMWAQGIPWTPESAPATSKDNGARQRVLDALVSGLKDEAIARQQGVSVKTVRRHITALMHDLGVTTRFAAGVAAVRQGLVTRPG